MGRPRGAHCFDLPSLHQRSPSRYRIFPLPPGQPFRLGLPRRLCPIFYRLYIASHQPALSKEITMRFGRFTSMILSLAACSLLSALPAATAQSSSSKPATAASSKPAAPSSKAAAAAPAGDLVDINSASADQLKA